jgi:hypothetical protein
MKFIKFVLLSVIGVLSSTAIASQTEFLFIHPPGGGSDLHTSAVIANLEKNGITAKKSFFKTCTDAVNYSKNKNNTFIVTMLTDWNFSNFNEGANCPPLGREDGKILPFSKLSEMSSYICSVPGSDIKTVNDVKNTNRRITVATPFPAAAAFVQQFANQIGKSDTIKAIPYPGASGVKLAVTAKDVELFFTSAHYKAFMKEGATCFAATMRNAPNGIPYLGDLAQLPNLKESPTTIVLMSVGHIDSNVTKEIAFALNSATFLNELSKVEGVHTGLGKGETPDQLFVSLKSQK